MVDNRYRAIVSASWAKSAGAKAGETHAVRFPDQAGLDGVEPSVSGAAEGADCILSSLVAMAPRRGRRLGLILGLRPSRRIPRMMIFAARSGISGADPTHPNPPARRMAPQVGPTQAIGGVHLFHPHLERRRWDREMHGGHPGETWAGSTFTRRARILIQMTPPDRTHPTKIRLIRLLARKKIAGAPPLS